MTRIARHPLAWLAGSFILLLTYITLFYPNRLSELHTHWTTVGDLDMGYFLLLISLYFCHKNIELKALNPNLRFLPIIILLASGFILSQALDIKTLFFLCLAISLPLFCLIVLGVRTTHSILIPWAILLMAFPFWYLAIPLLQALTVKVVSHLASLLSLTVLVEGNYFTVTTGVVHVAGGCSGLKYFMTAISLGLISSAINKRAIRYSLLSLIIAATLAMIGNWIRVFILLLIAYYEGIDHPLMADHDTLGWIVFAIVMLPWFFLDKFFDSGQINESKHASTNISARQLTIALGSILIVLIGSQLILSPPTNDNYNFSKPELPNTLNKMKASSVPPSSWKPNFPKPTNATSVVYENNGHPLEVHILTYLNSGDTEMANGENTIFDMNKWLLISDTKWASETKPEIQIRIALAKSGNEYRVVYYWFQHGDKYANSTFSSKLHQFLLSFTGIHQSHFVALSKPCNLECQSWLAPSESLQYTMKSIHDILANQ